VHIVFTEEPLRATAGIGFVAVVLGDQLLTPPHFSVLSEIPSGGIDASQKLADVLPVLVQRQVPCRTRTESVTRVGATQPRVVGAATLVRPDGEHFALDFERERRNVRVDLGVGGDVWDGFWVEVSLVGIRRLHGIIITDVSGWPH
jgi:hypothetical protein